MLMSDDARFAWAVVVPVKVLARAKSRIAPLAGSRRAELALAMAMDTIHMRGSRRLATTEQIGHRTVHGFHAGNDVNHVWQDHGAADQQ